MSKAKFKKQTRDHTSSPEAPSQTISLTSDMHHFIAFMGEEYQCDFPTALNAVLRVGMHQLLAKMSSDRELNILRLRGEAPAGAPSP